MGKESKVTYGMIEWRCTSARSVQGSGGDSWPITLSGAASSLNEEEVFDSAIGSCKAAEAGSSAS